MKNSGGILGGKRTVITGGCRGLGREIAARFSSEGAGILIIDRRGAISNAELDSNWIVEECDFLDSGAEPVMAEIARKSGPTDIVVANAGIVPPWRRISELNMSEWSDVFKVNVEGVALTLKCFAPGLAESGAGSAIVMASLNSWKAHPRQALYTATKHAVLGLTRAAALDMGGEGIRVNAICPGPIATEALQSRIDHRHTEGGPARNEALKLLAAETALDRIATTNDVAGAALFLASDLSAGITGAMLQVDCGIS